MQGELLRDEVAKHTSLGTKIVTMMSGPGLGVSCDVLIGLLRVAMRGGAARGVSRFLIDGFPRSMEQVGRGRPRAWGGNALAVG